ncbi:hypothetical protein P3X46_003822 [Hevea brasiliensis]|uniref:Uncharacterized protein n=1 Tax=Hevea brasiliensis TaxID=3981 RepID=A0ABQ9N9L3_HEVBR|nr:hypothetical protein P3X46_003822 [Hevea brasiliensis]
MASHIQQSRYEALSSKTAITDLIFSDFLAISPIRLEGIMFAGYILRAVCDLCRLCYIGAFSEGILFDHPFFSSSYATHWVER